MMKLDDAGTRPRVRLALGHHLGYVIGSNVSDSWDFTIESRDFAAALRCIFSAAPVAR